MKAAIEEKEGGEDRRYLLNFNIILFGFSLNYSVAKNVFLNYLRTVVSLK